ncbi:hypothetical protein [Neisseria iguanae]|uniref:hypothetical protein n=1 Tax=Neisseria iguanae TaxID=90242 RepID=UPI001FE84ADA|nr:hypothetical protein [Neisseria iguanae]
MSLHQPIRQPTVLLAVPYMYGLDLCIEKNLRYLGYNVINLCYDDRDSYYPNLFSRACALYHKTITHDSYYKKRLKFSRYQQDFQSKLAALDGRKAEYALCIRANIYPKSFITQIREHSTLCVNYQWDGINRFPDILQYLEYFDHFFVFDQQDTQHYPQHHFQPASNFYFDFPIPESYSRQTHGLYFLGGYDPTRESDTQAFITQAHHLNLPLDFYIYSKDDRAKNTFGNNGIQYLDRNTVLSFEENLNKIYHCRAIVDFVTTTHQGLSFRTFEALGMKKKLITTNAEVKKYDFYHPDNIFIWSANHSLSGQQIIQTAWKIFYNTRISQYRQKYQDSMHLAIG